MNCQINEAQAVQRFLDCSCKQKTSAAIARSYHTEGMHLLAAMGKLAAGCLLLSYTSTSLPRLIGVLSKPSKLNKSMVLIKKLFNMQDLGHDNVDAWTKAGYKLIAEVSHSHKLQRFQYTQWEAIQ